MDDRSRALLDVRRLTCGPHGDEVAISGHDFWRENRRVIRARVYECEFSEAAESQLRIARV